MFFMAASTLLCIHRDPDQLMLLRDHGYELAAASNSSDALRLMMSQPVDAVVVEHGPPALDGTAVARAIKNLRPEMPIIMLADHMELPATALESVDALVVKADGEHFLLATVHFILNVKPAQRYQAKLRSITPEVSLHVPRFLTTGNPSAPFSQQLWKSIKSGDTHF
jgi:DNA-binding response OmpR family regulator